MNDPSPTPITDAAARAIVGFADEWVPSHVAEELERQLAETRREGQTKVTETAHRIAQLEQDLASRPTPIWIRVGPDHPQTQRALGMDYPTLEHVIGAPEGSFAAHVAAERPTPITDAETMRDEYDHVDTEFGPFAPSETVSADFARDLERQLAEAHEQLDRLAEALALVGRAIPADRSTTKTCYAINDDIRDTVHKALAAVKENEND